MVDEGRNCSDCWQFSRYTSLNHGSVGTTPTEILKNRAALEGYINSAREAFIRKGEYQQMLDRSHGAVCDFVGADTQDLVLTDRVTDSLNTVMKSLTLGAGDEVLITSHMYPSYPGMLEGLAQRQGFKVVKADVPYPVESDDQIVAVILDKVSGKTRIAIIDHISSPTGIIFPVKRIVDELGRRGVDVFIDGAHAPGQIAVDVEDIGAAYYAGANYKWLCAPLTSGFLHVRRDRQDHIIPAVGSGDARYDVPFQQRFGWQGVMDPVPRIMVADTIEYMASLHPEGWPGIYRRNHELALKARELVCSRLGLDKPCPDHMVGTMFTIPLRGLKFDHAALQKSVINRGYDFMTDRHNLEVYFSEIGNLYLPRVSCHLYNKSEDYQRLTDAMEDFVRVYLPDRTSVPQPVAGKGALSPD